MYNFERSLKNIKLGKGEYTRIEVRLSFSLVQCYIRKKEINVELLYHLGSSVKFDDAGGSVTTGPWQEISLYRLFLQLCHKA
jgi:hypothetical protein